MSAIDEVKRMLDAVASRNPDSASMEALCGEMVVALQDIASLMGRDDEGKEAEVLAAAIGNALRGISINVNPTPITVQPAQINVAAPNVTVQAAASPTVTGWKLTVVSRDGNGAIREFTLKPEN